MAKRGPASGFKPEYCKLARKFCILGATNEQLAEFFDVALSTIGDWLVQFPEFKQAVNQGRAVADADVAESLYGRATGYDRKVEKIVATAEGPAGHELHQALRGRHRRLHLLAAQPPARPVARAHRARASPPRPDMLACSRRRASAPARSGAAEHAGDDQRSRHRKPPAPRDRRLPLRSPGLRHVRLSLGHRRHGAGPRDGAGALAGGRPGRAGQRRA